MQPTKESDELSKPFNQPQAEVRFKSIATNLPQTVRSKRRAQLEESRKLLILWCRGRDSNPHGLLGQRILSPLRLPFRHPGKLLDTAVT